jgi:hypothetical protein
VEVDPVEDYKPPKGSIDVKGKSGYLIDTRENHAYKVVNKLMDEGVKVWRLEQVLDVETGQLPPGCFIVDKGHDKALRKITEETGIDLHPLEELQGEKKPVKRSNVGLFRRYWGGNMDEGWTRLCLEQYGFKYTTIMDKDILEGGLSKIDVLILPSDSAAMILGGDELKKWWKENRPDMEMPNFPPEYRSGIGNDGKQKIRDWVNSGGRLICLGESGEFAIDALDLKVANVLKGVSNKVFHCPGSTLHVNVDICHPLGFGMPEEALALFWSSPAYKIVPNPENHKYHVVATFPDSNLLESGWLIGEEKIANKIAMLDVEVGKGKAVLIGIRCQHRCQTNGTFKLLFNALLG